MDAFFYTWVSENYLLSTLDPHEMEGETMKYLLQAQLVNRSDRDQFCFSITCLECGRKWASTPESRKEVFFDEDAARDRALDEALQVFRVCPICGNIVCQNCFESCGDLHMCRACARTLHRQA